MPEPRDNGGGRALRRERPGPNTTATPPPSRTTDLLSVTHGANAERRRQVRRLAAIELTRMLRGPVADLRPIPPGPAICPPSCAYCSGRRAA